MTEPGVELVASPRRTPWSRTTSIFALLLITSLGCRSHRVAILGATTGLVTGPVTCVTIGLLNGGILLLPLSPLLGVLHGWQIGGLKDREFAEYGRYDQPGTRRLSYVFLPFLGFPKGFLPGQWEYPKEAAVPVIGGENSESTQSTETPHDQEN